MKSLLLLFLILVAGAGATNWFPSEAARNAYIQATYGTGRVTQRAHDNPTRFGLETDLNYVVEQHDDDGPHKSSSLQSYVTGVAIWPGIALILGFSMLLLVLPITCCCRSCRCCLRCQSKCCQREGPASNLRRNLTLFTMVSLAVFIAAAASAGLAYNQKVTDTQRQTRQAGHTLMSDTRDKIDELTGDVVALNTSLDAVLPAMQALVDETASAMTVGITAAQSGLTTQGQYMLNATVRGYFCAACQAAGYQLISYGTQVGDTLGPVVDALANIRSEIESTLIDAKATIEAAINEAVDRMADARKETVTFDENIDHYGNDYVGHYDYMRNAITAAVYSLNFLIFVLLLVGLLTFRYSDCSKSASLETTSCSAYGAMAVAYVMFLMLAIHVPLSLLVADTCQMVDKREIDISSVFPDDHADLTEPNRTISNAIKTCLCDENFISTFGYDADLEFRNKITFPDEAKMSINFTAEIAQLDLILAFNLTNFGTVSPADQEAVQAYLNTTFANVTALKALLLATQTNLTDAQTELLCADDLLEPSFDLVDEVEADATCGFLGTFYGKVKNEICADGIYNLGVMSLTFFFVSFTIVPLAFVILALRDQWAEDSGGGFIGEMETEPLVN